MSLDRGDAHYDDAGNWPRACRHIGLFLWWAADRGVAAIQHDPAKMKADPTGYFIDACDSKLQEDDLNNEGKAFARARYGLYVEAVATFARDHEMGTYDIPHGDATTTWFFAWLDAELRKWRTSHPTAAELRAALDEEELAATKEDEDLVARLFIAGEHGARARLEVEARRPITLATVRVIRAGPAADPGDTFDVAAITEVSVGPPLSPGERCSFSATPTGNRAPNPDGWTFAQILYARSDKKESPEERSLVISER